MIDKLTTYKQLILLKKVLTKHRPQAELLKILMTI